MKGKSILSPIISNLFLKIFSIIFAILLFIAVHLSQSKEVFQTIKYKLSLSIPNEFILSTNLPEDISIVIKGPKKILKKLQQSHLSTLFEIKHSKVIHFEKSDFPELKGLEIIKIIPDSISINIEPQLEKEVPIILNTINSLPKGYLYSKKPTLTPSKVKIAGPQSYINLIEQIYTTPLNQNNLINSKNTFVSLKQDSSFIQFKNITTVKVNYEIVEKMVKKEYSNISIDFLNCDMKKNRLITSEEDVSIIANIPYSMLEKVKSTDFNAYVNIKNCETLPKRVKKQISVTSKFDKITIGYVIPENLIIEREIEKLQSKPDKKEIEP